jgi:hypothetical protein
MSGHYLMRHNVRVCVNTLRTKICPPEPLTYKMYADKTYRDETNRDVIYLHGNTRGLQVQARQVQGQHRQQQESCAGYRASQALTEQLRKAGDSLASY